LVQAWLEHQLSDQGLSAVQLLEVASRSAAADQISIANSISSLRFISALDWGTFVEDLSLVESMLRLDPARIYADQDFLTRDRYRHAIEAVTRGSSHSELEVAAAAVHLAQAAEREPGIDDRTAHVGYYLVNKGRPALERTMDSKVPFMVRLTRVARPLRLFLYLAPMVILTAIAIAIPFIYVVEPEQGWGWYVFFAIVGLFAASALIVPIMNLLVTVTVPPRVLPRLDFSEGIPAAHRTMVVVPTLLGRPEDVAHQNEQRRGDDWKRVHRLRHLLGHNRARESAQQDERKRGQSHRREQRQAEQNGRQPDADDFQHEIGRASCRERV
jgi:hypothetical protein